MADGGKNDVDGVALTALEIAAAEMAFALHVADDRLDGGAAAEFTFDRAEDAALLPGDEDATRALGRVAAISLVDIGAFDGASGQLLGRLDDTAERMAIVGVAGKRSSVWITPRTQKPALQ